MTFTLLAPLFKEIIDLKGSDIYLTYGFAPSIRVGEGIRPAASSGNILDDSTIDAMLRELIDEDKVEEFLSTYEYNTAISWEGKARFRVNIFRQQQHTGIVIRRIQTDIPTTASLGLPPIYNDLIMEKRGLILVCGPTGSGKSTSLAAMIGYRNANGSGHIVTVEDPIEYVHAHNKCIVTQRDLGIDTFSFGLALKNALRQRPDVVLIGEIRDRETMEHAINFAETGHLCVATLHANNSNQAIERVLNFFPEEKHRQILLNLSLNLRAILSQRLVLNKENRRSIALEIMLNKGFITKLIEEGKVKEIKEIMEKSRDQGMVTFDQSLLELFTSGKISEDTALAESDNSSNLRLSIKQISTARRMGSSSSATISGIHHLKV